MNVEEALEAVEQNLLSRQLTPIERLVLIQSWLGKGYEAMARDSAYGTPYIKEVGSHLWHALSQVIGQKVTKKNLSLVITEYQQSQTKPEFSADTLRKIEFPGGPVPLDSPLYINRPPIEELACQEISQSGCLIRIKAPRHMGKSSLLIRILARATELNYHTIFIDFQDADAALFKCLDKFLRWVCANVSRQLNLDPILDDYWDKDMGSKVSCKVYFDAYVLPQVHHPLILAFNEVNRVFEHPHIAQDFLPMLRSWHEQARAVIAWQKLRVVLVHSTEIYIQLKLNQSPFNVGLAMKLSPFSLEQVQDLACRYGLDWTHGNQAEQLMAMVGGHPYLVSIALYYLSQQKMTLEELLQTAPTPTGVYSHHLREHLVLLQHEHRLVAALSKVVNSDESVTLEAITAYKLESMGLIQLNGNRAQPNCELYRLYFRTQLKEIEQLESTQIQL